MRIGVTRWIGVSLFVLLGIVVVVGAAAAGAASAPAPAVEPVVATVEPMPEAAPAEPAPVQRKVVLGRVVGKRDRFLAVKVPAQERPIVVAIRPATRVRVDRQPATLDEVQIGDIVAVAGRMGPRGNLVAGVVQARRGE